MRQKLYLLKIGGSIITDTKTPRKARLGVIRDILRQVKEARRMKRFDLIIGHGSGSFAHIPAKKYRINDGLAHRFSRKGAVTTHMVAKELNSIVVAEAIKLGLDVFPFSPSSFGVWNDGKNARGTVLQIKEAQKRGMIPVIYGDVVIDTKKGVTVASTEMVFDFLTRVLKPDKLMLATDVDGIFDKDPKKYKDARLIKTINRANIAEVLGMATGSNKVDVTGGMHSKLAMLYEMVRSTHSQGIITNGLRKNSVRDALLGRVSKNSTLVKP